MRIFKPQATKAIPPGAAVDRAKGIVTYKVRGKFRRAVLTDSGRMRVETGCWRIEFRDCLGRKQSLAAFTHEGQSRLLASRIEALIAHSAGPLPAELRDYFDRVPSWIVSALQESGLLERDESPLSTKPLTELLAMYEQALRARERSAKHVYETVIEAQEVFTACGFTFWRDIKDHKVEGYLKNLRQGHILRKRAKGKEGKPRHVGYRRSNAYLTACQSFCNWVVDDRKWAKESPLRALKHLDAKQDPRHTRRALDVEQLRTLLQKTADGPERYGMSGRERYLLYRVAVETGLRAGELRRLRKADFDLDAGTVAVRAVRATKAKRTKQQALTPGLCAELREFLSSKLPAAKAFGGRYEALTDKTADMVGQDLKAARLPYKDDQGDVFDFHALRVECASLLIDSGVDPKQAQDIMRHSSIGLTMDVYAKIVGGKNKARAVASLPDLSLPESQRQAAARTGTDDRDILPESLRKVYAEAGKDRMKSDNIGQVTCDIASATAFSSQNQGSGWTVDPKVEGSRPFGLVRVALLAILADEAFFLRPVGMHPTLPTQGAKSRKKFGPDSRSVS